MLKIDIPKYKKILNLFLQIGRFMTNQNREYTEIINIIENKRWDKLKYSLADMHAAEIVDIIRILDNDKNTRFKRAGIFNIFYERQRIKRFDS